MRGVAVAIKTRGETRGGERKRAGVLFCLRPSAPGPPARLLQPVVDLVEGDPLVVVQVVVHLADTDGHARGSGVSSAAGDEGTGNDAAVLCSSPSDALRYLLSPCLRTRNFSFSRSHVRSLSTDITASSAVISSPLHSCSTCTTKRNSGSLTVFSLMAWRSVDLPTPLRPTRPYFTP